MTRKEELEKKLDSLLEEFKDIDYEEVVETLEYYASIYQSKINTNY